MSGPSSMALTSTVPSAETPHVSEQSRCQEQSRILDHGTHPYGPRPGVDPVIREVEPAAPGVVRLIPKTYLDLGLGCAWFLCAHSFEVQGFRRVECEIDRIQRVDGGQAGAATGLSAHDQVARVDASVRDSARNGRAHLGEFQLK
ncbi:hypothetical protein G6F65_021731 [Rhizopus arrhizus]|nr:hypothetical protein G6F65_021731 [Rhizopus arrhizus]